MITRKEIEQYVKSQNAEDTIDFVWDINCAAIPQLLADGHEGNDCRFGLAEHVIHKFFATQTAKNLPNGAFPAFCEQFHASEEDIATALSSTLQTAESDNITASDIASTMIWLWFIDATKEYGIYDVEMKFFLYSVANMSRGDQELRQAGAEKLANEAATHPFKLFQLLSRILSGRTKS